jgi:NADH-quinone oxidoreductase subunit A
MSALAGILIVCLAAAFVWTVLFAFLPMRNRALTEPQKIPFLGGSAPETHAWQRYHVRYYTMTLLFIAFEMEMMFMYPWAVVYVEEGLMAMTEMGMFLAILAVGILYGWREGVFRWQ